MADILQGIDIEKTRSIAEIMETHGGWGVSAIFLLLLFAMGLYILKIQRDHRKYREKIAETFETHRKEAMDVVKNYEQGDTRVANRLALLNTAFNDLVDVFRYGGVKIEVKEQEESATIILKNGEKL